MTRMTFDEASARALEVIYMTPDVVAQRARVLDLLALVPGERVLDIGVGPGLLAHDLARLVGETGRVTGIDLSPDMVAVAQNRLRDMPQAELRTGEATVLDIPDASLDAVVSTQVFEYVVDVPRALAEVHRVLRPGGRVLILDTDWRSLVWHSSDQARMDRALACWDDHLHDPHLPARLGPMMRRAGFEMRRVEILPMLTPRYQPVSYAAGMLRSIFAFVGRNAAKHGLSDQEVQAWQDDQADLIARDEFFLSLNRFAFLATR
jgi:ubiquinone/menaquinone biosynthesis C-methylase UbiE